MHFSDLDLRVGLVKAVKDHPDADKLYILLVDLGKVERDLQIVSGLKDYYKKEELIGKKIVILRNLKPAVFRGIESNGMLLAADSQDVPLLMAEESEPGDKVTVDVPEGDANSQITFKDWQKVRIEIYNNKPVFDDKILKTEKEEIKLGRSSPDGTSVA